MTATRPGECFSIEVIVPASAIDQLGHTNNVAYLRWLEQAAWVHTEALGLGWAEYQRIGVACVARRHTIDYLGQTHAGDRLLVDTWIAENPGKTTMTRAYQIRRAEQEKPVLTATTLWACVRLSDGRPVRMPPEFVAAYQVVDQSTS